MKIIINNIIYICNNSKVNIGDYGLIYSRGFKGIGKGYSLFYHDDSTVSRLNSVCEGTLKVIKIIIK